MQNGQRDLDNLRKLLAWCKFDPRRLAWLINDLRRKDQEKKNEPGRTTT